MLRALVILIVAGSLLSCVLTPPVFSLLELLMDEVPWPYSRVFDRVALIVACGLVYALRERLDLASLRPYYEDWRHRGDRGRLLFGAALTLTLTLVSLPLIVSTGLVVRDPVHPNGELLRAIPGWVLAALLISVIEESFFRVLVFEKLRTAMPTTVAALVASLFYAVLHFVSPDQGFEYTGWSPTVGFEYLAAVGAHFLQPGVGAGMVGLVLIGLTLCFALRSSGSLGLCIGLHAGWVLAVKASMRALDPPPGAEFPGGTGSRNFLVSRPEAWGSILVCFGILWLVYRRRVESASAGDAARG